MAGTPEVRIRKDLEHAGERLAHLLASGVARTADFLARSRLEHAVVGHEGHQRIHVMTVPAVAEGFQVFDRDHRVVSPLESNRHRGEDRLRKTTSQFPIQLVPGCERHDV